MRCAVVVAHPDDETLWCGGRMLLAPEHDWAVFGLCRASDGDRAPKFERVCAALGARGTLADLDDGPEQKPLDSSLVQSTILGLLQDRHFDIVYTHGPAGEYTRHRRHEECSAAVVTLFSKGLIHADKIHLFAYQDAAGALFPILADDSDQVLFLPLPVWRRKVALLTDLYGFSPDSWEARACPRVEGGHLHGDCFRLSQFWAQRRRTD